MSMICWQCGRAIGLAYGRQQVALKRDSHGFTVHLHRACAQAFDVDLERDALPVPPPRAGQRYLAEELWNGKAANEVIEEELRYG